MLILASIASSIILILAMLAVVHGGGWIAAYFLIGGMLSFGTMGAMLVLIPPILFFLFLSIPVAFRKSLNSWPRRTAAFGAASVPVFGIVGWNVWQDQRELARLKAERPLLALSARLPTRTSPSAIAALNEASSGRLAAVEKQIGDFPGMRTHVLQSLHESTMSHFINSPGFGVARMVRPSAWRIQTERERNEKGAPVPQPHRREASAGEGEDRREPMKAAAEWEKLHQDSTIDFVNPEGFGYVNESKQVAGFEPHQFAEAPKPAGEWTVATVDLVGLLLSETPRVYESKNLPRMDELKNAPTRPLDRFETDGLEKIRGGEDLIVAQTASGVRMFGAIRSAKQCLQCHQGNRGDLLGAFTYRLERKQ